MAIVKAKPTSPGRRGVVRVKHDHLWKGKPHAPLVESQSATGGRNNNGRITTRVLLRDTEVVVISIITV